jgi:signal transduction histidine kinase
MSEIVDFLQSVELLRDVPREQLEWFVREGELVSREPGLWFHPGMVLDFMMMILEGEIQAYVVQSNQKKVQFTNGPGTFNAQLPFSRMKTVPVYLEVLSPLKVLTLSKDKFHDLVAHNYELTAAIVHGMTDRVRHFSTLHFQNEKLMALGKLSAGLAHELNNPAAAVVRGAGELKQTVNYYASNLEAFASIQLTAKDTGCIKSALAKATSVSGTRLPLLERKALEDRITDWLEENNVVDDCAETFANFGLTNEDLESIRKTVSPPAFRPLLAWLASSLEAESAVHEIETAAKRISELIQSVKSYTRMDQVQDMQELCINEGIENTLTMLDYKARHNNITVHEELAEDLPLIIGFPGELNQVWTNIIDNALDAMKEGGELTVRTFREGDEVVFSVTDNGPGIPPENLERIFDPFFTTKEIGEGTGVGLDLVQKVAQIHKGKITVNSRPGYTEFKIVFPEVAKI